MSGNDAGAGAGRDAAPDGQDVEHHGESGTQADGPKTKKATLDDQIQRMKEERNKLKAQKSKVAAELKLATRKRRRLKKRASQLSVEDLFDVCRIKELNPDSMAASASEPPAAQS